MYAIKNETEDKLFVERSKHIKRMKPTDIMLYLGINQKFIFGGEPISRTSDLLESSQHHFVVDQPFKME